MIVTIVFIVPVPTVFGAWRSWRCYRRPPGNCRRRRRRYRRHRHCWHGSHGNWSCWRQLLFFVLPGFRIAFGSLLIKRRSLQSQFFSLHLPFTPPGPSLQGFNCLSVPIWLDLSVCPEVSSSSIHRQLDISLLRQIAILHWGWYLERNSGFRYISFLNYSGDPR